MGKHTEEVPKLRRGIRWAAWEKDMLTCLRHANVSVAWKKSEAPTAVPKRFPLAITAAQVACTVTLETP